MNAIVCLFYKGNTFIFSWTKYAVLSLTSVLFLTTLPCFGSVRDYDHLFEVTTEEYKDFISYPSSGLQSVVKVSVSFQTWDERKPFDYEDYWYANQRPIGCRRHKTLSWPGGKMVLIYVRHKNKNPSETEIDASANVIARLLVLISVKDEFLHHVVVPASSLESIAEALRQYHFIQGPLYVDGDKNTPMYANHNIYLVSEPPGQQYNLMYMFKER